MLAVTAVVGASAVGQSPAKSDLPPRTPIPHAIELSATMDAPPLVVYPDLHEDGPALAGQLAAVLENAAGVTPTVTSAARVAELEYSRRAVILLGNILTNAEILWLYALGHTFVDAAYPGGDGHVIHQVYDPEGGGRNVLIIGASTDEGLRRGVARFVDELTRLEDTQWQTRLLVESSLDVVVNAPKELDEQSFSSLRDESFGRMRQGNLSREVWSAIHAAQHYAMSGHRGYLQRYHARVLAQGDFTATGADQFYGGLEFWLPAYIQAWQLVEAADCWTEADCTEIVSLLVRLVELLESRYHTFVQWPDGVPRPRWNHETFPAQSYFFLSEYLRRRHPEASQVDRWTAAARLVLGDQVHFIRGTDESYGYLPYSPSHALRYALAVRDPDLFTSGRAAELGRLLHMLTDNTGRFLGAGTQEHRDMAYYCLLPIAAALRDGQFLSVNHKTRRAAARPTEPVQDWGPMMTRFGQFRPPLSPAMPNPEPDVQVFAMGEGLYRLTNSESIGPYEPVTPVTVPRERTFDKVSFRRGYDPTAHYLLLDGFGRGRHPRLDTNAIVRFTAHNRVFLVETDNDRTVAEKVHNMVTVIRNGRGSGHVPPFAELQAAVDLDQTAFSRSRVPEYGSVHWTRNIAWIKDDLFAVLDQVEAREDGEYVLRCHWNGLGRATVAGPTLVLDQNGASCAVTHAGGLSWSITNDAEAAERLWQAYPHAEAVIRRARQSRTVYLHAGEQATLGNVLYAFPTDKPRALSCRTVAGGAVLMAEKGFRALVFADPRDVPGPLETDALCGLVTDSRLALVGVRRLEAAGLELLSSDTPVHVECDLPAGLVTFGAEVHGRVRLAGLPEPVTLNGKRVALPWPAPDALLKATASCLTAAADATAAPAPRARTPARARLEAVETPLPGEPSWALFPPRDTALEGAVVVGDATGCQALRLTEDGVLELLWKVEMPARVTALAWAHAGEPGASDMVVCGAGNGVVTALRLNGSLAWHRQMKAPNSLSRSVLSLATGDVNGDGVDEIAVGSMSWNLYLLSHDGELLWEVPAYAHRITSLAVADISGDGRGEVLAGTNYYTLSAFDADGRVLLGYTAQPLFRALTVAHLDAGKGATILAANGEDVLAVDIDPALALPHTYVKGGSLPRSGRERFRFATGDDVHAIDVADVDGDGRPEVLAASESGFVYCFEANGDLRHVRAAGGAVRSLSVDRERSGGRVVAAGLSTGSLVIFDGGMNDVAEARLNGECRWLSAADGVVLCVTPRSVARARLP